VLKIQDKKRKILREARIIVEKGKAENESRK